MSEALNSIVCDGCPHLKERVCSTAKKPVDAALTPKGALVYTSIDGNIAGMGRLGENLMAEEHPELISHINDCSGPTAATEILARRGIMKYLGLTKAVEVSKCGAVDESELNSIASMAATSNNRLFSN